MDIRPIDANALIEKLDNINPVDYGAMSSYETHNGARDALSDAVMHVNDMPTLSLNTLRDAIYQDAVAHGLWEIEDEVSKNRMLLGEETGYMSALTFTCAQKIKDECYELVMALTEDLFSEELADVIIMSMSVAGKLGIDIDAAIRRKMEINKGRAWKHGKE